MKNSLFPIIRPLHISCLISLLIILLLGLLFLFQSSPHCSQLSLLDCENTVSRCCTTNLKNSTCEETHKIGCLSYQEELNLHKTIVGITMGGFCSLILCVWMGCLWNGWRYMKGGWMEYVGNLSTKGDGMPPELRPVNQVQ